MVQDSRLTSWVDQEAGVSQELQREVTPGSQIEAILEPNHKTEANHEEGLPQTPEVLLLPELQPVLAVRN